MMRGRKRQGTGHKRPVGSAKEELTFWAKKAKTLGLKMPKNASVPQIKQAINYARFQKKMKQAERLLKEAESLLKKR